MGALYPADPNLDLLWRNSKCLFTFFCSFFSFISHAEQKYPWSARISLRSIIDAERGYKKSLWKLFVAKTQKILKTKLIFMNGQTADFLQIIQIVLTTFVTVRDMMNLPF